VGAGAALGGSCSGAVTTRNAPGDADAIGRFDTIVSRCRGARGGGGGGAGMAGACGCQATNPHLCLCLQNSSARDRPRREGAVHVRANVQPTCLLERNADSDKTKQRLSDRVAVATTAGTTTHNQLRDAHPRFTSRRLPPPCRSPPPPPPLSTSPAIATSCACRARSLIC
jgi:hypothetical protein